MRQTDAATLGISAGEAGLCCFLSANVDDAAAPPPLGRSHVADKYPRRFRATGDDLAVSCVHREVRSPSSSPHHGLRCPVPYWVRTSFSLYSIVFYYLFVDFFSLFVERWGRARRPSRGTSCEASSMTRPCRSRRPPICSICTTRHPPDPASRATPTPIRL